MKLPRRTFSLLLAMTPGIGGRTVTRILARNELLARSPEEFFTLSPEAIREEYRLSAKAAANLLDDVKGRISFTLATEKRLSGLGVEWVTTTDAHYPAVVEEMDSDPPGVLFLYGNTRLLEARTFCVLGSRNTFPADLELIEKLTEEGVLAGEVLVTGHDRPEYQRSAVVPLRWGAPRVLCLDRGLFQVLGPELKDEAFRAARLWRYEFDPSTDLVVSPFRPDSGFIGQNNRIRDRLVGSLSLRLAFVNIAEGGNMEALAKMALKAGRKVIVSDRCIGYRSFAALAADILKT
ncbi:MAG TPA: DNA-processing protein DprA [Fimbriimonas sp.]|nr:DNA-processing protein DprA [Fimbriimonas sp.]